MFVPAASPVSPKSTSLCSLALIRDPLVTAPNSSVATAIKLMSQARRQGEDLSAAEPSGGSNRQLPAAVYQAMRSSSVAVVNEQRVAGFVSESAIVDMLAQQQPLSLAVEEVMTPVTKTLQASAFTDITVAIALFQQEGLRYLPVVDHQQHLVGVITQESLYQAITRSESLGNAASTAQPAENSPRSSGHHSQAVLKAIPDLILRVGPEGDFREIVAYRELCVFPEDYDLVGRSTADVLPPHLAEQQRFYLAKALATGELQVFQQQLEHNGQTQVEEVRIAKCGDDEALLIIRDITEHAQAEAALRQSELTTRIMIETIPDLLIQMDLAGRYQQMSGGTAVCVQYPSATAPELDVHNILAPEMADQRLRYARLAIESGQLQIYEQILEVDNQLVYEEVRIAPLEGENVLVIIRDISDRKQAELALNQLIEGTAATGPDFFPALVRHMAEALQVSHAVISEPVGDQLRALAVWCNNSLQPPFSYQVAHTPCELTLQNGEYSCESGVKEQFPESSLLEQLGVDSYIGISLTDSHGNIIGSLCVLHQWAIADAHRALKLLRVFATRAAAELERQQVIALLEQLNHELEAKVAARTQSLRQVNRFQQALLDCANYAIISTDPTGLVQSFNAGAERMLGYPASEVIGQVTFDMLHVGISKNPTELRLVRGFQWFSQNPHQDIHNEIEWSYMRRDGVRLPIALSFTPLRNDDHQVIGFLSIAKDITERKAAQKKLQASEEKFRNLVENANDIIYTLSADGVITYASPNWTELLGHPIEAVVNRHFSEFVHPDDVPYCVEFLTQVISSGTKSRGIEYRVQHSSGEWRWHTSSGSPQVDPEGNWAYSGIAHDITDRKLFESELNRINTELIRATRLKDEFLANMSHELRTPLNAILGMTEGLQEAVFGEVNPVQRRTLRAIEDSSHHLLELINDVLDVARMEAGQVQLDRQVVAVGALCKSSLMFVKQQALKKQIRLQLRIPSLPSLWADERRIRQVLINLLDNAIKFTPEGGCVTLEASQQASLQPQLQITVTDTGIGIAPEHIGQLFQAFVQVDSALNRKYDGTGLGLSLVKRIVELHGGAVSVSSQVGQGSCFTLDLPCVAEVAHQRLERQMEMSTDDALAKSEDSVLILLAEDNEANILTVSSYLEAKGFRVCVAKDGQEAIALTLSRSPDLILMDIQMPGMDGIEAIRQLRSDPAVARVPIIALTALAMEGDRDRCLTAGADEYISKPVMLQQLTATIRQMLSLP